MNLFNKSDSVDIVFCLYRFYNPLIKFLMTFTEKKQYNFSHPPTVDCAILNQIANKLLIDS